MKLVARKKVTRTTLRRKDKPSHTPAKATLNRLLIEQFYETSVRRYGSDSDQAQVLSRLLSPADLHGPEKTVR
jgi:hypothetical protein